VITEYGYSTQVVLTAINSQASGPRWALQIVVLLGDETHFLSVNQ